MDIEEPAVKGCGYQAPETKTPPHKPIPRQPKFRKFQQRPKEKEDFPFPNNQSNVESKYKKKKNNANFSKNELDKFNESSSTETGKEMQTDTSVNQKSSDS